MKTNGIVQDVAPWSKKDTSIQRRRDSANSSRNRLLLNARESKMRSTLKKEKNLREDVKKNAGKRKLKRLRNRNKERSR